MKLKLNIKPLELLAACLLTVALLLPTVLQFSHIFEDHEHVACTEASSHMHETPVDCSFQDYQISTFTFHPIKSINVPSVTIQAKTENFEQRFITSTSLISNSLRGPPSLS